MRSNQYPQPISETRGYKIILLPPLSVLGPETKQSKQLHPHLELRISNSDLSERYIPYLFHTIQGLLRVHGVCAVSLSRIKGACRRYVLVHNSRVPNISPLVSSSQRRRHQETPRWSKGRGMTQHFEIEQGLQGPMLSICLSFLGNDKVSKMKSTMHTFSPLCYHGESRDHGQRDFHFLLLLLHDSNDHGMHSCFHRTWVSSSDPQENHRRHPPNMRRL